MAAGTSTILTSPTRHCAPNNAEPSLVIRLTTCDGGSDGGMIGAGGGIGAGCANRSDEIITTNANDVLLRHARRHEAWFSEDTEVIDFLRASAPLLQPLEMRC